MNIIKFFTIVFLIACYTNCQGQLPVVNIAETTIKINGLSEQNLYYGFAEGDQLVFDCNVIRGKTIKELEIIEYPGSSRFMDFKCSSLGSKTISIPRTGVYLFRFKNGSWLGKVCKIKIDRIPSCERTKDFNSAVRWVVKDDTSWTVKNERILVGYDTIFEQKRRKVLTRTELQEEVIADKSQRVHSKNHLSESNLSTVSFQIPTYFPTVLKTKTVVSWAYWVGTGEEGNRAWDQNIKSISALAGNVAKVFTSPLGGLLVGTLTQLILPKSGENVIYGVADNNNRDLFIQGNEYKLFDSGNGVAGYRKFSDWSMMRGNWNLLLANDNLITPIDVTVKVVALVETKTYEYQNYIDKKLIAKYENKILKTPTVKMRKVPTLTK